LLKLKITDNTIKSIDLLDFDFKISYTATIKMKSTCKNPGKSQWTRAFGFLRLL
jgi:hypothetical protein